MHLFATHEGDKWVCVTCREEQADMIEEMNWEYIFDRSEPMLRCALCKRPDFEYDD